MMNISHSLFLEIFFNANAVRLIDRPAPDHKFRRDEMLICGVPSEDGLMFEYFICHTARDIIGIPRRFVTWFLCEGYPKMNGCVIVTACNPAVSRMVRGNPSTIKDVIDSIEKELPQRQNLTPIVIMPQQKTPQISPRIYWKAQRRHNPNDRCYTRGRPGRQH